MPDGAGTGASNTKWLQPQNMSVSVNTHGYPADVYAGQRHDGYFIQTPSPFSQQSPIAQPQLSPYSWSPDGSRLHQPSYSLPPPAPPQQQQPQQPQPPHPPTPYAELVAQPHFAHPPPTPSAADDYIARTHAGRASLPVAGQHSGTGTPSYIPPPELVNLGLAARDSRLDERWTTFMHENGFLDGMNTSSGVSHHY